MNEHNFFETKSLIIDPAKLKTGEVSWQSPSNIALIKYWGKHGNQLPNNPSVSLTLTHAYTRTTIQYGPRKNVSLPVEFSFLFEGKPHAAFEKRIGKVLEKVLPFYPFLSQLRLEINSKNSFPHSSGIASSASAMSALALCLCSIEGDFFDTLKSDELFEKKASFVARLGSGSACRSIYSHAALWGETQFAYNQNGIHSSNEYAIPFSEYIHPVFHTYKDTILLVNKSEKEVSSSVGHQLMDQHPYRKIRIAQANRNAEKLCQVMKEGNVEDFTALVEKEALELHALMMTSSPPFILMEPGTIAIIKKVRALREETNVPICFTLDAGANVHLLYPENFSDIVEQYAEEMLLQHCEHNSFLQDEVGVGPIEF